MRVDKYQSILRGFNPIQAACFSAQRQIVLYKLLKIELDYFKSRCDDARLKKIFTDGLNRVNSFITDMRVLFNNNAPMIKFMEKDLNQDTLASISNILDSLSYCDSNQINLLEDQLTQMIAEATDGGSIIHLPEDGTWVSAYLNQQRDPIEVVKEVHEQKGRVIVAQDFGNPWFIEYGLKAAITIYPGRNYIMLDFSTEIDNKITVGE